MSGGHIGLLIGLGILALFVVSILIAQSGGAGSDDAPGAQGFGSGQAEGDTTPNRTLSSAQPATAGLLNVLPLMSTVGGLCLLIGLYFLIDPTAPNSSTANLHRLTLGSTFTTVGAIFIAADLVRAAVVGVGRALLAAREHFEELGDE